MHFKPSSQTTALASLFVMLGLAPCLAQAQSSVTLYGVTGIDLISVNHVGASAINQFLVSSGQTVTSRFGLKGSEDLGSGLSAIFGLENGFNNDTGTQADSARFFSRGSWVGLKGSFGTVTAGRQWNVNDTVLNKFFIFGSYSPFRYTDYGFISNLHDNAVKYASPKLGDFQFHALGAAGEKGNGTLQTRTAYEAAATYDHGPFSAAVTYHERKAVTGDLTDKLTAAGVNYSFKPFRVRLGVAQAKPRASAHPDSTVYDLALDYNWQERFTASIDYTARNVKNSGDDSSFVRLLGQYYISKRTSFNVNVVLLKNKGQAAQTVAGVGTINAGTNQNLFSLGIRHTF